jgi:terminase small subunit-like protein
MMNDTVRMFQGRNWAEASDEEVFASEVFTFTDEETAAYRKEREKRLNQKRQEQERIEQERINRLNAIKNALQYSGKLAQEICERISSGELLTVICRDEHMPTVRHCNQWLKEHEEFQTVFNMSLKDRLMIFEEQVIEIADDMNHDFKTVIKNGLEKRVADPDMVARAKLRIEVRFRHLKAGKPERWGDVSTLITKSDDAFSASNLSDEALEKKLADLEIKDRIMKAA